MAPRKFFCTFPQQLISEPIVSHTLGGSHRVSLTLDFSALDVRALSSSLRRLLP